MLAKQLDQLGAAIGVDLNPDGEIEVPTDGGRSIDIVANDEVGTEFVIENQYGDANHDHMTRGLAYAVARRAQGLVVVAEHHRDEFRAVAEYLNRLAEQAPHGAIRVWLVEVKPIRVGDSAWAPLFVPVVEPNDFTASVEAAKRSEPQLKSVEDFYALFLDDTLRDASSDLISRWRRSGDQMVWLGTRWMTLVTEGPSQNGRRSVVSLHADGHVGVPFSSYAGGNTGIAVEALTTDEFRSMADELFGFTGSERFGHTSAGWLTPDRVDSLYDYCIKVAAAYADALASRIS